MCTQELISRFKIKFFNKYLILDLDISDSRIGIDFRFNSRPLLNLRIVKCFKAQTLIMFHTTQIIQKSLFFGHFRVFKGIVHPKIA